MSKTCPKCGAEYNGRPAPNQHDYWCGSTTWGEGDFYQSPECVRRERDQLVERIKRLEEALDRITFYAQTGILKDSFDEIKRIAKEAKP